MRLEADDGRPETSPPLRRGVQTADRAVVTGAASHPGRSGPSTTSRDRSCGAGSRASAAAAPPGPRTTARPSGTSRSSRSSRGGATGSWRWRWTFQNKRRRYSHEGRRDTGRRGEAREPDGPAGPTATPRTRIRRAILPMSASAEAGRTCACWLTWRTGASPAIPPGGPGMRAWCWPRSPPSTSR